MTNEEKFAIKSLCLKPQGFYIFHNGFKNMDDLYCIGFFL